MGIKIDSKSQKVLVDIKNLEKNSAPALKKSLYFVGKKLRQTASKNILKRGRQGRVYKYKGRRHISSSPEESWANRSGTARRGLTFGVVNPTKLIFGNTVPYAKYLEFGTRTMKPRPAHRIAIEENNTNIITIISDNLTRVLD